MSTYQLPFVVIAAIYFGAMAWPMFDGAWTAAHLGDGLRRVVPTAVVLTAAGLELLCQRRDRNRISRRAGWRRRCSRRGRRSMP